MADSFDQLRLEFLAETEDTLATLQRDLNQLGESVREGSPDHDLVDRVFRTTHSLKGVAGMFGLDEISAVSHSMENVFDELRDQRITLSAEILDLLYQGNEALHRLLAQASGRGEGDPAGGAERVQEAIASYLKEHGSAGVSDFDPLGDPLVSAFPHLVPSEQAGVREAIAREATLAIVDVRFDDSGFELPFRQLLEAARSWGTVHGTVPGERDDDSKTFHVRLVVSGTGELFALMKAVGPIGADVLSCDPALLGSESLEAVEPEFTQFEFVEVEDPAEALRTGSTSPGGARAGELLRVPVERIDRLLSELGDLIQAKMSLDNTAAEIVEETQSRMLRTTFLQSLRNLDRRIRLVQDEVLRARMVTMTPTFQMLERTVRETCRATAKEARLVTSGEGVEVDKRIVESVTEPLVHLVRNAVDHGLESAEARREAGRDPVGTVRLEAYPEGSYTVLEVSDDGAGIDLDRILQKGRERGLIAPKATPSRSELLELIFRAGFTVREEATTISGRGVGLDAVRAGVADLGGLLEVDTGPSGTLFRMRIPTTLAVTQALRVEVAGESFFVPLSSVSRVARIFPERIERVDGEEILVDEDRAVPVRDLAEVLGTGRVDRGQNRVSGVFLGLAEKRLLLLVDHLGGRREIVVRSLGELLPSVPGIAGSTELGDGQTVLILDPVALFDLSFSATPAETSP